MIHLLFLFSSTIIFSQITMDTLLFERKTNQRFEVLLSDSSQLRINGKANIVDYSCQLLSNYSYLTIFAYRKNDTIKIENGLLKIKVANFDCGQSAINSDFQEALMAKKYPEMSLELQKIYRSDNDSYADVSIKIAATKKLFKIKFDESKNENMIKVYGKKMMKMSDFNIKTPTALFGLIKVYDELEIEVLLYFKLFRM
jgi:hypothetical protein